MNLVSNPWIPVVDRNGAHRRVSLREAFAEGEWIADFSANPCQRIALMRLLICIAQAALDGPADDAEWQTCLPDIAPKALAYLDRWQHRFNLFGKKAFLQVDGLEERPEDFKPVAVMDATSASGGAGLTSLWDHALDYPVQTSDHKIALDLLVYMNFSCGGKVGKACWNGTAFNGSAGSAPSYKYLHTYVIGDTLVSTIHLNMTSRATVNRSVVVGEDSVSAWGKPIWEHMPDSPHDDKAFKNATLSYLGRLVPLSRLGKIFDGQDTTVCIVGPPPKLLQMQRLPYFREPWATVIRSTNGDQSYLPCNPSRHIWRDLDAILRFAGDDATLVLPSFVNNVVKPRNINTFRLWSGGAAMGKNESKVADIVEWSAPLSAEFFGNIGFSIYQKGLTVATNGEGSLIAALSTYYKPDKDKPGVDKKCVPYDYAKMRYWTILDHQFGTLQVAVEDKTDSAVAAWTQTIRDAMHAAYAQTCPHETPRQLQAYARGLKQLRLKREKAGS